MTQCAYLGCNEQVTATTDAKEMDGTTTQYPVCDRHVGEMDCVTVTVEG